MAVAGPLIEGGDVPTGLVADRPVAGVPVGCPVGIAVPALPVGLGVGVVVETVGVGPILLAPALVPSLFKSRLSPCVAWLVVGIVCGDLEIVVTLVEVPAFVPVPSLFKSALSLCVGTVTVGRLMGTTVVAGGVVACGTGV